MNLLVVNPNNRLSGNLPAVEPPLWAGLTAAYWGADILDAEAEDLTLDQTVDRVRHKNVLIVVMGNNPSVSSTPKMPSAEQLAAKLAFKGINVVMTGIHPIAAGCHYPVIKTPFHGFPMMPWAQLPMHLYRAHNWHCLDGSPRSPYASIYTSLGCPYNCYYCNIHTLYGGERKVRFRPLADIRKEVEALAFYQVRNIKIWDELFALSEDRVLKICDFLKWFDLNIWAYARLDTVTPRMLGAMKKAGINWLAYGFENVRDPKFKRTEEVVKMTRDAGIAIMANFMFKLPGTTEEDDKAGVGLATKHLFEFVNFYDAKPYPGSKWYQDVTTPGEWEGFSQYGDISAFRKQAFRDYFTNPDYLSMLERKWGVQAVKQIETMLFDGTPTMKSSVR